MSDAPRGPAPDRRFGKLYLLPAPLRGFDELKWSADSVAAELPARALSLMGSLRSFIVESERSALRLLSRFKSPGDLAAASFHVLDEHGAKEGMEALMAPLLDGQDCGLLSEAGMPCVADPGAALVAAAHIRGIEVVPVSGPSSILLALSASGLSGQRFSFLGYLPAPSRERRASLQSLGRECQQDRTTRICIETPYRNDALLADAIALLPPTAWLSVAADIGSESQTIVSKPVGAWREEGPGSIGKRPAVFLFGYPADIRPADLCSSDRKEAQDRPPSFRRGRRGAP